MFRTDDIDLLNPVSSHQLNSGLVSWWLPLPNVDGGTLMRDLVGPNHLTLTNGPVWETARGDRFRSVKHDGSNDWLVKNSPVGFLNPSTASEFTFAAWLRTRTISGKSAAISFTSLADGNSGGAISIQVVSGNWYAEGKGNFTQPSLTSNVAAANNTDYLVGFTRKGATNRIYVNGVERNSNTTTPQNFTINYVYMAAYSTAYSFAQHYIKSGWYYKRALSPADMMNLYNQARTGYPDTLRRLRRPAYYLVSAPPGGFQSAWARGSNVLITPGVI